MARKTTFTEQLGGVISRGIEAGLSDKAACGVAGVTDRTYRRWLAEGKRLLERDDDSDHPLAAFARMVEACRACAAVNTINEASKTDWTAAAFMLERLHPETFGPPKSLTRDLDRLERRVNELACRMGVDLAAVGV